MGTKGIISTMIQDRDLKRGREGGGAKSDETELTATLRHKKTFKIRGYGCKAPYEDN